MTHEEFMKIVREKMNGIGIRKSGQKLKNFANVLCQERKVGKNGCN